MFKVEKYKNRYKISIGTGELYPAANLQEVVYALQHFFRESIPEYPFDSERHGHHAEECGCCPLCKA